MADRKPDDPPPARLSDEYAAAIAAHKAFLAAHPNSVLSSDILRTITGVAVEYAKIDAWEVAEGIYADLAASKLKIRRPERLDFARGVCELGRAMPAHAREVLMELNAAGLGEEEKSEGGPTAVAVSAPATPPTSGPAAGTDDRISRGGGGFGGRSGAFGAGGITRRPDGTTIIAGNLALDEGGKSGDAKDKPSPSQFDSSAPAKKPAESQPQSEQARHDSQLLAMIQRQEYSRSARVAQLNENLRYVVANQPQPQGIQQASAAAAPPLSAAELTRLQTSIDAAYTIFQEVRKKYADAPTAEQARGDILVMIGYWRGLTEWERSADLAVRFLSDSPLDPQLPQLRLEAARDLLAWAAKPIGKSLTRQELLSEVATRFAAARKELGKIIADFVKQRALQQEAQWDLANSFLSEARAVSGISPTLARGQFVRARVS